MFEEQGLLNLHDFEARARVVMRKGIFDMVDGGFNDEITYKRTQRAFDSIGLVPRYLKDVDNQSPIEFCAGRDAPPHRLSWSQLAQKKSNTAVRNTRWVAS